MENNVLWNFVEIKIYKSNQNLWIESDRIVIRNLRIIIFYNDSLISPVHDKSVSDKFINLSFSFLVSKIHNKNLFFLSNQNIIELDYPSFETWLHLPQKDKYKYLSETKT